MGYIAVAGNIGSGKTSLVGFLSNHFGLQAGFEPNDENPFLARFYTDMRAWSFHSQMFFLARRIGLHQRVQAADRPALMDRTLYEDAEIFANNLYLTGLMGEDEYAVYHDLYRSARELLRPPSLLIFLRCRSRILYPRIRRRGRPDEQTVPKEYVDRLNLLYGQWFHRYDLSEKVEWNTGREDYATDLLTRIDLLKLIERCLAG